MINLASAAGYIDDVRWQFAKTMPEWPHEYTIKAWRPKLSSAFEQFCQLILDQGNVEPWPPAPDKPIYHNHYLVIGSHKYWAMGPLGDGDPIEAKSVINRELCHVPE
jgi:hypothetical protein